VTTDLAELGGVSGAAVLQTGLFSREENAQALVRRLNGAGFSAALGRRQVNGVEYWVVTVPAGTDTQQTIMRLKDAGFEAFPVF
jgi:cell division septation protein DedD